MASVGDREHLPTPGQLVGHLPGPGEPAVGVRVGGPPQRTQERLLLCEQRDRHRVRQAGGVLSWYPANSKVITARARPTVYRSEDTDGPCDAISGAWYPTVP